MLKELENRLENLGGQDCLIGNCTEGDFKRLKKTTKLNFEYLY